MRCVHALGLGLVLFSGTPRALDVVNCTQNEAYLAETQADTLSSWNSVYRSFRKYHKCDNGGGISEGYSVSVGNLLANHWATVTDLLKITAQNKKFEIFVLSHIDATLPLDQVNRIKANAKNACPAGAKMFCRKVIKASM